MKKQIVILFTLAASISFSAQRNPQIRNCNLVGGDFVAANTSNDQVGFCQLDKALIGALELNLFNNKEAILQSLKVYMKNQLTCENGGQIQNLTIVGTSDSFKACAYPDGSFIELMTLTRGYNSSENQKLNQVLGL